MTLVEYITPIPARCEELSCPAAEVPYEETTLKFALFHGMTACVTATTGLSKPVALNGRVLSVSCVYTIFLGLGNQAFPKLDLRLIIIPRTVDGCTFTWSSFLASFFCHVVGTSVDR